jgi:O-antigen/teichoic acid export membrane protein
MLTSFDRFRMVATVTSSAAVVRTALVVTLVALGWGASGVIYGTVVGMFVEGAVMSVVANRAMRATIGRSWRSMPTAILGAERRAILSFMLHTELVSLAGAVVKHADVVILGAASGPQAAGHYRLAWQIVGPLTRIALPLQEVFYTRASRLAAVADWDGLRQLIRRQTKAIGIPLAGLVLLGIPVVMLAIPRIAGRNYAAAVAPAAFLLVAAASAFALFWLRPAYLASGLVRPLLLISTMAAAASLAGFLLAAPVAGATGVAGVRALVTGIAGGGVAAAYLLWKLTDRTAIHPARSPQEAAS